MSSCFRNIVVRSVLLLCAMVQLAVLMPHHHHTGAVCFDAVHCGGDHDHHGGNEEALPHDHHGADEVCATVIIAARPRVEQASALPFPLPVAVEAHHARHLCSECRDIRYNSLQSTIFKGAPPLERLYTACIVRTVPGRAPTVMV